jgi:hypothetical protein
VLRDAARERDRLGEALGERERGKPRRVERNQGLAEVLQLVHRLLAPGLRRRRIGGGRRAVVVVAARHHRSKAVGERAQ